MGWVEVRACIWRKERRQSKEGKNICKYINYVLGKFSNVREEVKFYSPVARKEVGERGIEQIFFKNPCYTKK